MAGDAPAATAEVEEAPDPVQIHAMPGSGSADRLGRRAPALEEPARVSRAPDDEPKPGGRKRESVALRSAVSSPQRTRTLV